MMAKKTKHQLAAALKAREDRTQQQQRAARSSDYRDMVDVALTSTKSDELFNKMLECGDRYNGNLMECHSLYCAKEGERKNGKPNSCFKRITEEQKRVMASALNRYGTEAEQRENLRSVTILFSVFGYDLAKSAYPTFPLDLAIDKGNPKSTGRLIGTVMDAKAKADSQLKAMKNRFPSAAWLGAYSWETIRLDCLGAKKEKSVEALLKHSKAEGIEADGQSVVFGDSMDRWRKHYITFHAHLVVDLRGTDAAAFRAYCHKRWGLEGNNKRPVPDGVKIKNLVDGKNVAESLETLAVYPFLNQWNYKYDYNGEDEEEYPIVRLEPEILSALINGLALMNRKGKIAISSRWG